MSQLPSSASSSARTPTTAAARHFSSPLAAIDATKLGEELARLAKAMPPSGATPAMDFGRYVRREVDAAPDSAAGVLAMEKFLRLDPVAKEIDQLKTQIQVIQREFGRQTQAISPVSDSRGSTPCERLMDLWATEDGRYFLRTAKTIDLISQRIGKGLTVTKGSPFFKSVIAPARKAYKSFEKYEASEVRDRADRAREMANERGGHRKRNRPRNRPTK